MKRMLIEISQRIKATLCSGDVVARLGGDELVMVLKSPSSTSAALTHEVSQRLLTRIATPVNLPDAQNAHVGCSLYLAPT